jgi:hypothetical protein
VNTRTKISLIFYLSALYDGVLGLAFLFAPAAIFACFCTPPPNHLGYVQFPACLLLIFAAMFFNIARDQDRNRDLILYGIFLKISYCAVTGIYWSTGQLPPMWQPFTVCDFFMALAYLWAYRALREPAPLPPF